MILPRDNWTPLHGAVSSGRAVAISLLLNRGADIHWLNGVASGRAGRISGDREHAHNARSRSGRDGAR